jgi:endonuclease-3
MTQIERIAKISELLKRDFPEVTTPLFHKNGFELLIATMLSPQTLDDTTNKVTKPLFEKFSTAEELSKADFEEVSQIIKIVNYHRTKSKNIITASQMLLDEFKGEVPNNIIELTKLPGVGRKVANVVISEWYGRKKYSRGTPRLSKAEIDTMPDWSKIEIAPEGFVVDTHVLRTSQRLGLTLNKTPEKVEQDLMKIFPKSEWAETSLRLIFHGRFRCKARDNQCCNDPEWSLLCECEKTSS